MAGLTQELRPRDSTSRAAKRQRRTTTRAWDADAGRRIVRRTPRRAEALAVSDTLAPLVVAAMINSLGPHALTWNLVARGVSLGGAGAALAVPTLSASAAYSRRSRLPGQGLALAGRLLLAATLTVWTASFLGLADGLQTRQTQLLILWIGTWSAWLGSRLVLREIERRRPDRVLILGSGLVATRISAIARRHPEYGITIVGCVDDAPPTPTRYHDSPDLLGPIADLPEIIRSHSVARAVIAFSRRPDEEAAAAIRTCHALGVQVEAVPRFFEFTGVAPAGSALGGLGLLDMSPTDRGRLSRAGKRALDVALSSLLLILAAPLMLLVAVAIRLDSGGPAFYRQHRIGLGGRPFTMFKFRTMVVDADQSGDLVRDLIARNGGSIREVVQALKAPADPQVTRLGRWLRRMSLDELPQLLNVFAGQMSLVGPRPLRSFEVSALTAEQAIRQSVRPGLTGLWQVLGRSDTDWDERVELDCCYVRQSSILTDLQILAQTPAAILRGRGAR